MASELPWLRESLMSYYQFVDRIVVTYDSRNLSWTQRPLDITPVLDLLNELDVDNKIEFHSQNFHKFVDPMDNDTYQRQVSLNLASRDCDWVLQLDTDEVVPNASRFFGKLPLADNVGALEIWYPAYWVYNQNRFCSLVYSDRFLRPVAGYPGPVFVRPYAQLSCARQTGSRNAAYVVGKYRFAPFVSK